MTDRSGPRLQPFQFAWHVPDLDAAIEHWASLGVGPFFVTGVDSSQYEEFAYRGTPGELVASIALAEGALGQIELIDVRSSAPNVYHDLVAPDRSAMHHVGVWSDDYRGDKVRLAERYELAMDLGSGTNICYFDTSRDTGTMLELFERNDALVGTFSRIADAAATWDGTRPRRELSELF